MGERIRKYRADGTFTDTDTRTLAEAKAEAADRVMGVLVRALDALDDGPTQEAAQWWAIGVLKANAGVAFAAWPAAQQTAWANQVQPNIDAVTALVTRLRTARAAIAAATSRAQADAVTL